MPLQQDRSESADGRLLKDLKVFHDVARALTSTLDRDTVLCAIMNQMAQFFSPESWSMLLVDEARQDLYFAVLEGHFDAIRFDPDVEGRETDLDAVRCAIPARGQSSLRIAMGEGMAGWVAVHGEPLIVPDVQGLNAADLDGVRFSEAERLAISVPVQSAISLPLQSRGRTIGVIQLFNYRLESLDAYAITFLHILTDYAAIAIENARAMERIQELTITDDVTRLFNTRHLQTILQSEFERARRFHTEFSIIFVDLDHFKDVNDSYGHLVGTELLVEVAQLIQFNTRAVDMVFRYGGDEFVVLLPQTGKAAAVDAAQRLRHALKEARFLAAHALQLTMVASFGVATYPQDGDTAEAILQAADGQMYKVKHSTRDGVASA